jgi:RHS repeat-associated protein
VNYYFADHLGSSRVVTNAAGTILDDSDFYPFGGERVIAGSSGNTYKFTGKERDSESGLDNFGARYDSSSLGRFMSPDPLMASAAVFDPRTWNRYSYALNNPLRFVDPNGMKEVTAEECQKDPKCTTVKVNVIYDANANRGKGLSDKEKAEFRKNVLQSAKNEFGNAKIHFDVTETTGKVENNTVTGASKHSINLIVSDSTPTGDSGVSTVTKEGYAFTFINVKEADSSTIFDEFAHHFMGDTTGVIARYDDTGIFKAFANTFFDLRNIAMRDSFSDQPTFTSKQGPDLLMIDRSDVNTGARRFQDKLSQPAAMRPRQ